MRHIRVFCGIPLDSNTHPSRHGWVESHLAPTFGLTWRPLRLTEKDWKPSFTRYAVQRGLDLWLPEWVWQSAIAHSSQYAKMDLSKTVERLLNKMTLFLFKSEFCSEYNGFYSSPPIRFDVSRLLDKSIYWLHCWFFSALLLFGHWTLRNARKITVH